MRAQHQSTRDPGTGLSAGKNKPGLAARGSELSPQKWREKPNGYQMGLFRSTG